MKTYRVAIQNNDEELEFVTMKAKDLQALAIFINSLILAGEIEVAFVLHDCVDNTEV